MEDRLDRRGTGAQAMKHRCFVAMAPLVLLFPVSAGAAPPASTGHLHLSFTQRSPMSQLEELKLRPSLFGRWLDMEPRQVDYEIANESFEVIVPKSYRPGVPHGLFVWINDGVEPPPGWIDVLARHKMIWVTANNAGRSRPFLTRAGIQLDAVYNIKKLYSVDDQHVCISGFSGNGLFAAQLLHAFPNVFSCAFFVNGEDFYKGRWSEEGKLEPTVREYPRWEGPLSYDQIKKDLRIVILTGEKDPIFEPDISRMNYQGLLLDGFGRITYIEIPKGGHNWPSASWFEKGIVALDAKPKAPPTTSPTEDAHLLPTQLAQAKRLLNTAQELVDGQSAAYDAMYARQCLEQLIKEFPSTPPATIARELLPWIEKNIKPAKLPKRPTTTAAPPRDPG